MQVTFSYASDCELCKWLLATQVIISYAGDR